MAYRKLIITDSFSKKKQYEKIFNNNSYEVKTSFGHYKTLTNKSSSLVQEGNFDNIIFDITPEKEKIINQILESSVGKDIYIVVNPDRDGFAISKFLYDDLRKKGQHKDIYYIKSTSLHPKDIAQSIKSAIPFKEVNQKEFDAYLTRTISDRLIGYILSPLLSTYFKAKHSVGRVQTPALKLIVDREKEIKAAENSNKIYDVFIVVKNKDDNEIKIKVAENIDTIREAKKIAWDFKNSKTIFLNNFEDRDISKEPSEPFNTSELLQYFFNIYKYHTSKVMQILHKMFEDGYITYPKTDSHVLQEKTLNLFNIFLKVNYPEIFKEHRVEKKENYSFAVHNTNILDKNKLDLLFTSKIEQTLYANILARSLAFLCKPALLTKRTYYFQNNKQQFFRFEETIIKKKNYIKVIEDLTGLKSGYNNSFSFDKKEINIKISTIEIKTKKKNSISRYTEATLIKKIEELGIGRPSTYNIIINKLLERKYITINRNFIVPTAKAFELVDFIEKHYSWLVDINFSKNMEIFLDKIAEGKENWKSFCKIIYDKIQDQNINFSKREPATKKQIALARKISKKLSIPLPENYTEDKAVLSYWIKTNIKDFYQAEKK